MKIIKLTILLLVIIVLSWGVYELYVQNKELGVEVEALREKNENIQKDNQEIRERIEFFNNPENLVKELKQQFNYTEEGERLMIIIPKSN